MGDVAVDIGCAIEAHLLGDHSTDDPATSLNGFGIDRAFDVAGFADGQLADPDIATDGSVDMDFALAGDAAFDGDVF